MDLRNGQTVISSSLVALHAVDPPPGTPKRSFFKGTSRIGMRKSHVLGGLIFRSFIDQRHDDRYIPLFRGKRSSIDNNGQEKNIILLIEDEIDSIYEEHNGPFTILHLCQYISCYSSSVLISVRPSC